MAKELPFFKFEPSQWDNGNIQLCSFEAKGVFISVCSMYWQRLGDVPYKLAVQKICNGNATALDSLITEDVIKVIEGAICIDFLNEQLSEFENISHTNSENARSGWEKRRLKATAKRPQSEGNAIREEKIREEKKIVDKSEKTLAWFESQIDEMFLETLKMNHKDKDIPQAIKDSYAHLAADSIRLKNADSSDCKKLVNSWLSNNKPNGTSKPQLKWKI